MYWVLSRTHSFTFTMRKLTFYPVTILAVGGRSLWYWLRATTA